MGGLTCAPAHLTARGGVPLFAVDGGARFALAARDRRCRVTEVGRLVLGQHSPVDPEPPAVLAEIALNVVPHYPTQQDLSNTPPGRESTLL